MPLIRSNVNAAVDRAKRASPVLTDYAFVDGSSTFVITQPRRQRTIHVSAATVAYHADAFFCLFRKRTDPKCIATIHAPDEAHRDLVASFLKDNRVEIRDPGTDVVRPQSLETVTETDTQDRHADAPGPDRRRATADVRGERIGAFVIDCLVIGLGYAALVAIGVVILVIGALQPSNPGDLYTAIFFSYIIAVLILVPTLWILYFAVSTSFFGSTIGKRAVGMALRRNDGGRPSFWRLLARESLKLLSMASMIGLMANLIELLLFRRMWYDVMCGTAAVRKQEVG